MTATSIREIAAKNPQTFSVSVIMQQSPSASIWLDESWEAVGILATADGHQNGNQKVALIHQEGGVRRYLYPGFTLRLHEDECESYYHNLISPQPCCYVVANQDDQGRPEPFLVSLSFDEAHAYLEGDETVYAVPVSAELYRWTEAFVLARYVPRKRTKRKRADWKSAGQRPDDHEA
ncbi:MAG: DUF3305 domain-containing protein [Candidatus Thiodiazotropha sp. (ex Dulcina madagascariensis)]|nr:DUF3305 domain-containing protein [Candidatus Thiodiazotropha sp. (ex Dulcina madagascariensis)]